MKASITVNIPHDWHRLRNKEIIKEGDRYLDNEEWKSVEEWRYGLTIYETSSNGINIYIRKNKFITCTNCGLKVKWRNKFGNCKSCVKA